MRRSTFPSGTLDINWKIVKDAKWSPFKSYQCKINEEDNHFVLKNLNGHVAYKYFHADSNSIFLNFEDFAELVNTFIQSVSEYAGCQITVIVNFPCSYFSQQQLLLLPSKVRFLMLTCDYNWFYETVDKITLAEWELKHDIKLLNWRFEENDCENEENELDGRFTMHFFVNETLYRSYLGNVELTSILQAANLIPRYLQLSIGCYNHVWIDTYQGKDLQKVFLGDYFKGYFSNEDAITLCYHLWDNRNWNNSGIVKQKQVEYKYKN